MKKITIIGSGGSGKSTLASELGKILGLPVYHLDALHWKTGWKPTPKKEWDQLMEELVSRNEWIIDGNYGRSMDVRLQASDTIIYLDYPTYLSLFRGIKRSMQYYGKTRPDMGEGCAERIDFQFFKWILHYRRDQRPNILKKLNMLQDKKNIHIFASPKQLKNFLKQLNEGTAGKTTV
ncbi:DNA topology modulation protein [Paenibacillus sp. USDA918EY]|uniref:DNA topology modulation protein n=1 Tax=Paenibacillus sp. USDA918EY TaxID=2689575 RepID=UPI001358D175|nr:DNA topology modulation protein [Paenibacillus sp. USDA918EY]